MSGGHFDYKQYSILDIVESIEEIIKNNDSEEVDEYGDRIGHGYSKAVIKELQNGVVALMIAYEYANRADWLISGDDGEDSFLERLREDLDNLRREVHE